MKSDEARSKPKEGRTRVRQYRTRLHEARDIEKYLSLQFYLDS